MNGTRFDQVAYMFAERRLARRQALQRGGGRRPAAARDATPAAGAAGEKKVQFLFLQSFESGSVVPKAGEAGVCALTLAQGLGQTLYFSDRPDRTLPSPMPIPSTDGRPGRFRMAARAIPYGYG